MVEKCTRLINAKFIDSQRVDNKHGVWLDINTMCISLEKAISELGSQARLASLVGVVPMTVSQWLQRGLPSDRVLTVSRVTDWRVTPHQLRPDLYPNKTDGLPPEIADKVMAGVWPVNVGAGETAQIKEAA
jgi:DNA-binding transcriptional regulator YdaS (Cro superfamily)